MTRYYRIADLVVKMDSFGRSVEQAKPYLIEECDRPDIQINGDWQNLQASQPHLTAEECEYLITGSSFYRQLLNFDGMVLHSSAVVMDGRAYLFSASCGTGKSTHTQLWRRVFGERAQILNDDKPALRLIEGQWYAYGTPWSGKTAQNANMRVPLAGVCMLYRGDENKIIPYKGSRAIFDILEQTIRPKDPAMLQKALDLLNKLISAVPVWKLECNMDLEAAIVSYEAMSGQRKDN